MQLKDVVLVDGARSAFARGARGKLVATRLDDAGATVLRALLDRNPKVKDSMIEDVGLGNVVSPAEFTYLGTVQKLAGLPHEAESVDGSRDVYPSAYIGLECANGERLVLSHIRGIDASQQAEAYAREVIDSILNGLSPDELGVVVDD